MPGNEVVFRISVTVSFFFRIGFYGTRFHVIFFDEKKDERLSFISMLHQNRGQHIMINERIDVFVQKLPDAQPKGFAYTLSVIKTLN